MFAYYYTTTIKCNVQGCQDHFFSRDLTTNTEGSEIVQELRRLKEARICKICMDAEVGVVFIPCGHLICCVICAPSLKNCPMCRQSIQKTVKTFMA